MFTVISDTHLHNWSLFNRSPEVGENTRLNEILSAIEDCARAAREKQPDKIYPVRIYHGGDLFHVRGSLTPSVLNRVVQRLQEINAKYFVNIIVIAGNHDLETKDSCELGNAAQSLNSLGFVEVVSKVEFFYDNRIVMLPWRHSLDDLRADLSAAKQHILDGDLDLSSWTAIIHAPVNGVVMGSPDHGFNGEELASYGFGLVLSGHYHNHKEVAKQVYSIGALTHQTWGDIGSKAGYLTVGDDLVVTHHETSAPKFIDYDPEDEESCKGNYVRVRLGEVTESEIKKIRQHIIDIGALGNVIQSMPKREAIARSGSTVESGKSMIGSIEAWINEQDFTCDKAEVLLKCESILQEIEA